MSMGLKISIILSVVLLLPLVSASWVQVGPDQSTSTYSLSMSNHSDAYVPGDSSSDASVLYDGQGKQGGEAYYMDANICDSGGTPEQFAWVELLLTLRTNATSSSFNLLFDVQLYISESITSATGPFYEVELYNTATESFDSFLNLTETSSENRNLSLASTYMGQNGNVEVRLYSGHTTQSCSTYTQARAYEFEIFIEEGTPPVDDTDGDGMLDVSDACPQGESGWTSTVETDYDQDGCNDALEDLDDDSDTVLDLDDGCPKGEMNWVYSNETDWDGDGCHDQLEDADDDNDGHTDALDLCMKGEIGWISNSTNDWDSDGCHDQIEDFDDDNDGVLDTFPDSCPRGALLWNSTQLSDYDGDGCNDALEDLDDDGDWILDDYDRCPLGEVGWFSTSSEDYDQDGCQDETEDQDDDDDGYNDAVDICQKGEIGWNGSPATDYDQDGCNDSSEDADDDNDGVLDTFPDQCMYSNSTVPKIDHDGDGCFDGEDTDDDGDGLIDSEDQICPLSPLSGFDYDGDGCKNSEDLDDDSDGRNDDVDTTCPLSPFDESDYDSDGCMDSEDNDDDGDGVVDANDALCPFSPLLSSDYDRDGCSDSEDIDDDNDGILDNTPDLCPIGISSGLDSDGDGCFDVEDACPNDPTAYLEPDCITVTIPSEGSPSTPHNELYRRISIWAVVGVVCLGLVLSFVGSRLVRGQKEQFEDHNEVDRLELSSQFDESYLLQNSQLSKSWLSQQEPASALDKLEVSLSSVLDNRNIPQLNLKTAKGVLNTMLHTIKTPAGAVPFLRAMYASVVRAHREHLREALEEIGTQKLRPWKANPSPKGLLNEVRQGLSASPRNKYANLRKHGRLPEILDSIIPSMLEQIALLNKACHPEDDDSVKFEEIEFVICLNILIQFVNAAFEDPLR
jgi:hypothetical protein